MAEESLIYTPELYGGLFIDRNAKFLPPLQIMNALLIWTGHSFNFTGSVDKIT